ncbi:MAG: FliA/WhiG family RNA polymerase sigma factor [Deltaproteobacteria bacterium]|nr:FliA/WhiG family RNA polymerase sigma factor [Deltaproteobacteria bacterium]
MQSHDMHETATRFIPRIQKIARGIARHLPSYVDAEDLVQAGVVGMMTALKAFDPGRSGRLDVYVERRIRGAILDELRALDPLSRDQRRDARSIQAATRELETMLGRAPEEDEVALRSGVSVERLRAVRERALAVTPDTLDDERGTALADGQAEDPVELLALAQSRERLVAALNALPERQRQVLSLYYVEELSLKEIGDLFGVTESRVCQIHGEALKKLRLSMQDA